MKKTHLSKREAKEQLTQLFLETQLGVELDELMMQLVPEDDPWWGDPSPDDASTKMSVVGLPMLNRLSSLIGRMADWNRLAAHYLALGLGDVGTMKGAEAATMKGPTKAPPDYRSWKQGDMCLTLSVAKTKPFRVTLHIDEGPVVNVTRLMWVDMASIESDPLQPPVLRCFDVEPTSELRTFTVEPKPAEIVRRLSAIMAVEKKGTSGARLLLPFVEWD